MILQFAADCINICVKNALVLWHTPGLWGTVQGYGEVVLSGCRTMQRLVVRRIFPLVLLNRSNHRRPKAPASVLGPLDHWTTLYSTIVFGIIATQRLVVQDDTVACPTYIAKHIRSHFLATTHRPLILSQQSHHFPYLWIVYTCIQSCLELTFIIMFTHQHFQRVCASRCIHLIYH